MEKEELLEHIRRKIELAKLKGWTEYKDSLEAAINHPEFPNSFVTWPLSPEEKEKNEAKTQKLIQGLDPL